jgi:hypothetical protein
LKRDKERELDEVNESTIWLMSELLLPWSIWKGLPNFVGLRGIFSAFKSCIQELPFCSVRILLGEVWRLANPFSETMGDHEDVFQAA